MSLDSIIPSLLDSVESELSKTIQIAVSDSYGELRRMLSYHMGWEGKGAGKEAQGKRIRPLLVLLSSVAAGGEWTKALPGAVAVELIHNFSLIHDDIQDQSLLRRGRPTLWTKWGIAQAINTGDLMFTLANVALLKLGETTSSEITLEAMRILQNTCVHLTQGQHLDLAYEDHDNLPLDDYWIMVQGKTAALISASTEMGALIANCDETTRRGFKEFGHALGLAFQAWDDWLGIWGDAEITGKSTDSDLLARKKSLPILFGLSRDGSFKERWDSGPITPEEIPGIASLLAEEGAMEFTQDITNQLSDEALDAIIKVVGSEKSDDLVDLTYRLIQRKN